MTMQLGDAVIAAPYDEGTISRLVAREVMASPDPDRLVQDTVGYLVRRVLAHPHLADELAPRVALTVLAAAGVKLAAATPAPGVTS